MITLLKRGQIGFATNKHSQVAQIICWFTQSPWSHAFIITDTVQDRTYLFEANQFGVNYRQYGYYFDDDVVPTEIWEPINKSEGEISSAVEDTDFKFSGVVYGYLELFGIAFKILMKRLFGLNVGSPVHQGAICSQVACFYLFDLYPEIFGKFKQHEVSPADLYEVVTKSGSFRRVFP